ncbi:hypothetical protein DPMN_121819 [Dreissena polymorpha]|uniref:Uncharacterized protein n=1 Tax=Dreissena polymorpha TaxID=45954 RepID=A0A9D4GN72_DREPO|nr:hypothetical protein DPMN_121819 [Dreissena polymorpha]
MDLNQKWKVGEKTGSKDPPRYIGYSIITDRTILELQCTHTKRQLNPPKHLQDMAKDTKALDGRTEKRTDGQRQNNIPPPMAGDKKTT